MRERRNKMYIIITIVIAMLLYIVSIWVVGCCKGISTIESKEKVNNFLKDIFLTESKKVEEPSYNIMIGIDENGYPLSNELDRIFSGLSKIFSDYYFCGCNREENRLCYSFAISEPLTEMDDEDVYNYVSRLCDSMVHRYLHKMNPWFGHMGNLCAVRMYGNRLFLYIAENEMGRRENALLKDRMRTLFKRSQIRQTSPIEEDWGD